jgi:two-component system phosphate regulon sensor histidine kinase PhoR
MSEIEQLKKRLTQLQEEYKQFSYIVSHDFSAPFRQINGFAKIIKENNYDKFDEKNLKYFDYIQDAALECQDLMSALLEFSRSNVDEASIEEWDAKLLFDKAIKKLEDKVVEKKC